MQQDTPPSSPLAPALAKRAMRTLILECKERSGKSTSQISRDIGIARETVKRYFDGDIPLGRMKALQTSLAMSDEELHTLNQLYSQSHANSNRMHEPLKGLDRTWLATQPPEKQAGLLLRAFRVRSFKEIKQVADDIAVSKPYFNDIDNGLHPIPVSKMRTLQSTLNLSDEELDELNRLAAPFRRPTDRMDALDSGWLSEQEPKKQAGLLLRAYRVRACKTAKEFAFELGNTEGVVLSWELGARPISKKKMGAIRTGLGLSDEETNQLTQLNEICHQSDFEKRLAMRTTSNHLGAALPLSQCDLLREPRAMGR